MRREKGEKAQLANDSGIALILVLGILAVLVTLATTFAFNMQLEQKAAANYRESVKAKDLAIAGMARVVAELREDLEANPTVEIASGIYINEVMANTIAYWDVNDITAGTMAVSNEEGESGLDGTVKRNQGSGVSTQQTAAAEDDILLGGLPASPYPQATNKKYGYSFAMQRMVTDEDVGTGPGDGTNPLFYLDYAPVRVEEQIWVGGLLYTSPGDYTISDREEGDITFAFALGAEQIKATYRAERWAEVADHANLDIANAIAVGCWIYVSDYDSTDYDFDQTLFSRDEAYRLKLYKPSDTKGFSFEIYVGSGWQACNSNFEPTPKVWYHVVGYYSESTRVMRIRVLDSSDVEKAYQTNELTGLSGYTIIANDKALFIGRHPTATNEYAMGFIDEIRINEGVEDYIELYNCDSSTSSSLSGWTISDGSLTATLPSVTIPAFGHLVLTFDNLFHTGEWVYANGTPTDVYGANYSDSFCVSSDKGSAEKTLTLNDGSTDQDTFTYTSSAINYAWEKGDDPNIDTVHIASSILAINSAYALYGTPTTCSSFSPLMRGTTTTIFRSSCQIDWAGETNDWYDTFGNAVDLDGDGVNNDFTVNQTDISDEQAKININTASAALLEGLPSINAGDGDGANIISYRANVSDFYSIRQIMLVYDGLTTSDLIFTRSEYDDFEDYITVSSWINNRVYTDEEYPSSSTLISRAPVNINTVSETVFQAIIEPLVTNAAEASDMYTNFATRISAGNPFDSRSEFNDWIDGQPGGISLSEAAEIKDNADPSGADYEISAGGSPTDYDCSTTEFTFSSGDPATGAGGAFKLISTGVARDPVGGTAAESVIEWTVGRMTPLAYWDFNDDEGGGSETTARDIYGNNDGTLVIFDNQDETSGWTIGRFGYGLRFDGSTDYVSVDYDSLIRIPLTLEAWIYDEGSSGTSNIVEKGYNFKFQTLPGTQYLQISYYDGTSTRTVTTADVYDTSTWHHVVAVLEPSGSDTRVTFYVDGSQAYQETATGQPTNTQDITIGADSVPADYFDGIIDEVRIYNGAMKIKYTYGIRE